MRIIWTFFDILGIAGEEVDAESTADEEELLGVDGGFVEQFLEGARGDADAVGEPLVGVARATQLVADDVADVYLHSGCCCALATESPSIPRRPQTKKKASNFVSSLRPWKVPSGIDKMLAYRRAFAHCLS